METAKRLNRCHPFLGEGRNSRSTAPRCRSRLAVQSRRGVRVGIGCNHLAFFLTRLPRLGCSTAPARRRLRRQGVRAPAPRPGRGARRRQWRTGDAREGVGAVAVDLDDLGHRQPAGKRRPVLKSPGCRRSAPRVRRQEAQFHHAGAGARQNGTQAVSLHSTGIA